MAVIIFDLDGTLIDTGSIAVEAYRLVLSEFAYKPDEFPSEEQMLKTFGLPDTEIWDTLMPRHTPEEQMIGFERAGQRIDDEIRKQDILLPHAREVVQELHARGYTLTTASNCGKSYLDAVMSSQGIGHLFDRPLCLESVQGTRKSDILRALISRYGGGEALFMVGDRYTDRDAAAEVNIPFIGCDFGFGDVSELTGAIHLTKDLPGLLDYFA
ncbi:HAD family hydrolase [Alicyclobacillus fastidiosus]|uniref:HAD family hydrolase n=1 Tax=Alicyclobacillus fastidiosus TaxID=392011 RepID=A0ABY6ZHU9_9BACL|nr:HAD family hydrolase [Alicyclobacillus fastidiosus]WAH41699.1 HAD family hydrolase [Alicyclobacillus fastidiosus]GMA63378.1 phosphoglycolate phosphatase [Alicyclobacillus fastidiosus]